MQSPRNDAGKPGSQCRSLWEDLDSPSHEQDAQLTTHCGSSPVVQPQRLAVWDLCCGGVHDLAALILVPPIPRQSNPALGEPAALRCCSRPHRILPGGRRVIPPARGRASKHFAPNALPQRPHEPHRSHGGFSPQPHRKKLIAIPGAERGHGAGEAALGAPPRLGAPTGRRCYLQLRQRTL